MVEQQLGMIPVLQQTGFRTITLLLIVLERNERHFVRIVKHASPTVDFVAECKVVHRRSNIIIGLVYQQINQGYSLLKRLNMQHTASGQYAIQKKKTTEKDVSI